MKDKHSCLNYCPNEVDKTIADIIKWYQNISLKVDKLFLN